MVIFNRVGSKFLILIMSLKKWHGQFLIFISSISCCIFLSHTSIRLRTLVNNNYHILQKQISLLLLTYEALIFYKRQIIIWFNLIFIKSFLYSPVLPLFIVSIRYLVSSQSFVIFANTSLFPSVEAKTKYLFPLLQGWIQG